jgi:hypothetical protein
VALVSANAFLARIGIYAGAVAAPLGAVVARLPGIKGAAALLLAVGAYLLAAVFSTGLPDPKTMREVVAEGEREPVSRPPLRRRRALRLSRLATAGVRLLNGFLVMLLAFAFRDADAGLLDFGALVAAGGIGYGLASFLSPVLERRLREEPMVVAALAMEAAAAFVAGQFFAHSDAAALVGGAALAATAGLAWGTAKFAFDGLLQQVVEPGRRGSSFTRSETLFQLAWVIGAIIPVGITINVEIGLAIAGVAALTAQTVFVSSLLVGDRQRVR